MSAITVTAGWLHGRIPVNSFMPWLIRVSERRMLIFHWWRITVAVELAS